MTDHRYSASLTWSGSTAAGFERYDRSHTVGAHPAETELELSSDPAFRGDARHLNPEQLLVMAASSCQCLSFLAVAARARIDVVAYSDDAEGVMPADSSPLHIAEIVLRPRVVVRGDVGESRVRHLLEVGHRECFIANSLRTEIRLEATVKVQPAGV